MPLGGAHGDACHVASRPGRCDHCRFRVPRPRWQRKSVGWPVGLRVAVRPQRTWGEAGVGGAFARPELSVILRGERSLASASWYYHPLTSLTFCPFKKGLALPASETRRALYCEKRIIWAQKPALGGGAPPPGSPGSSGVRVEGPTSCGRGDEGAGVWPQRPGEGQCDAGAEGDGDPGAGLLWGAGGDLPRLLLGRSA